MYTKDDKVIISFQCPNGDMLDVPCLYGELTLSTFGIYVKSCMYLYNEYIILGISLQVI